MNKNKMGTDIYVWNGTIYVDTQWHHYPVICNSTFDLSQLLVLGGVDDEEIDKIVTEIQTGGCNYFNLGIWNSLILFAMKPEEELIGHIKEKFHVSFATH